MQFEFDADKQAINLRKHGIDLRDAACVFLDTRRLDAADERQDHGEERRVVVGTVEDRVWVVVYTRRADAIRLISARKANEREQKRYQALHT
jgi:uncharacterized protein